MTRMVACVRDAGEAAMALAGGADALEVRASPATVREVVAAAAGRRPVTAVAVGPPEFAALAECGVDSLRIPFAGTAPAAPVPLIATIQAGPDLDVPAPGFAGLVIEPASGRLLDQVPILPLGRFVRACRAHGLAVGLAGGLESPDVPRLLLLEPDLLLFSAALRTDGALDRALVRLIRGQVPPEVEAADGADYRLLSGRPPHREDAAPGDRIFVHDLVLPVSIGAYAHERLAPQSVRFTVEAVVAHARNPSDLRDVVSYDIITDGIRLLVEAGHVPLVETLAERIATMLLAHPRILRVSVRLEKLETGAGIVGVAIERSRAAWAALSPSEEQRTR